MHIQSPGVIKSSLTFNMMSRDRFVGSISAVSETDTHLIVPREYIPKSEWARLDFNVYDMPFNRFPTISVECVASPRNNIQELAVNKLLEERNGILSLYCGAGKTVVSIMAWCRLNVPALVVVHTADLMQQWKERIIEFTNLSEDDIGIYQGKTEDWQKPVCIAMLKTLAAREEACQIPEGFHEHFGVVIYDEVHNIGAPTFQPCAAIGRGMRWGLSATHERVDGMDALYKYHIGPVLFEYLEHEIKPHGWFIETGVSIPPEVMMDLRDRTGEMNLSRMKTWLGRHKRRNEHAASVIRQALDDGRKILCLSDRIEQLEELAGYFPDEGTLLHGKLSKKLREGALDRSDLILASTKLAKEGLDRKDLDTVFLLLPIAGKGMFRQILGRVQRKAEGKKDPILLVLEDRAISPSIAMCSKLRRYLREFGCQYTIVSD